MFYSAPLPYISDATAYFAAIADLPWAVWLDSGGRDRYDIIAAQPVVTLVTQGLHTQISDAPGVALHGRA
jgi:para-aminobenzoate synthetase component 1